MFSISLFNIIIILASLKFAKYFNSHIINIVSASLLNILPLLTRNRCQKTFNQVVKSDCLHFLFQFQRLLNLWENQSTVLIFTDPIKHITIVLNINRFLNKSDLLRQLFSIFFHHFKKNIFFLAYIYIYCKKFQYSKILKFITFMMNRVPYKCIKKRRIRSCSFETAYPLEIIILEFISVLVNFFKINKIFYHFTRILQFF